MSTGRNSDTPFYNWGILGGSCTPPVVHRVVFTAFLLGKLRGAKICSAVRGAKYITKFGAKKYI